MNAEIQLLRIYVVGVMSAELLEKGPEVAVQDTAPVLDG